MEKFILRGEDTFHLAPFKFAWSYVMFKNSLANHWSPQEIPMGKDKACFEQQLTDAERHLFTHVFATLTTADLAIGSNLAERIYPLIKAAELRLYLTRQIAEEGLHSHSYQHILEVLGLDQEEVYSLYQRVPQISQWFKYAKEHLTDDDILLALLFWYAIFEGVFFMTGFAAIYSLRRRNLMTGTGEQLSYIQRDESLHVGFGLRLIKEIIAESGYYPPEKDVHTLFREAMSCLAEWAYHCIPPVIGYNAGLHIQHAQYLSDVRLKTLGYSPVFGAQPTLPWLDEQSGGIKKESNFFEAKVQDYQTGVALSWDD